MRIVGITGYSGAGKDSYAHALAATQLHAQIAGFADPIRQVTRCMGMNPDNRETKEKPWTFSLDVFCDKLQFSLDAVLREYMSVCTRLRLYEAVVEALRPCRTEAVGSSLTQYMHVSPRQFMQVLGMEAQHVDERTVWVGILFRRIVRPAMVANRNVLIKDFRFPHEISVLDSVVCVINPRLQCPSEHESEDMADLLTRSQPPTLIGRPVRYFHNDGSLQDLVNKVAREGA